MKKMGRPKADNPKCRTLSFRMDEGEYLTLKEYALKHSLTITRLVKMAVADYMNRDH